MLTPDDIQKLYAPFHLKDHSIREGHRNKAGDKIQWFVYLDRWAIQRRLDALFPGEWDFIVHDIHRGHYVTTLGEISVKGVRRMDVGESTPWGTNDVQANDEKGAVTGAFRRCAAGFGLGAYLYDATPIWTPSYQKGDWTAMRNCEGQAKRAFADWFAQTFGEVAE